jgi:DNA-binding NtrC family response regulator
MKTEIASLPSLPLLLVDDEVHTLRGYEMLLLAEGITNVLSCQSGQEALKHLSQSGIACILLDLAMPGMSGEEVLSIVTRDYPEVPVIVVTATNDVETAVRCMKAGAFDYIVKPVDPTRLVTEVKRALDFRELQYENALLKQRVLDKTLEHPEVFAEIITQNEKMKSIFRYIESIAGTIQPVLINGETGVGKEMIARVLHPLSKRQGDFVSLNIAGLDDNVFADTLFGHKRGAFTGADRDRGGLVEKAARGTLFLDEIGDLSIGSQIKLLRLLQEHEYYPLGSDVPRSSDARVIVATNRDLYALQDSGHFRKDLYYRLRLHQIHLPALRERRDDIPLLAESFLQEAALELNKPKPALPQELLALLSAYSFPGNIRELRAMIYEALSRHESGRLSIDVFKEMIRQPAPSENPEVAKSVPLHPDPFVSLDRLPTLEESEDLLIQEALKRTNGNQTVAAELLGITRQTLHRRLTSKKQ